jgi:BON domain
MARSGDRWRDDDSAWSAKDYRLYGRRYPGRPRGEAWPREPYEGDEANSRESWGAPGFFGGGYFGYGPGGPFGLGYGNYGPGLGSDPYGPEAYGNPRDRYRTDYDRDDRRRSDEERGWWDRASDEVASWFGDEEAERRRRMDERGEWGHHRGRGPKGYTRSDERIQEDINDRLTDDAYIDASEIEVSVRQGEVTLTGTVDSRMAKRRAEDIADSVSGVKHVQNNLRVH